MTLTNSKPDFCNAAIIKTDSKHFYSVTYVLTYVPKCMRLRPASICILPCHSTTVRHFMKLFLILDPTGSSLGLIDTLILKVPYFVAIVSIC